MLSDNRENRKGQTIIEAIVALAVLTTGFMGILTLLSRSFTIVRTISDQTTATYLAAEGIELSRSILDHSMNSSSTAPWPCFPNLSPPGTRVDFGFDYTTFFIPNCNSLNGAHHQNQFLTFNPATGFYGYGIGPVTTGFKRDINISEAAGNKYEAIVISTVTWNGGTSKIQLEDHIYNWLP